MKKAVVEGSHAVAEAVRLSRVEVISAYPITPQTHIVEALSEYCSDGSLDSKFICVESEHSAMAAVIGAASAGVRTFTATCSHGLALMHEMLHWASGARLPIVMAEVNRAMGPGWNIWADQTDSLSQRDTGWLQFYCESAQEVLDTTIMSFKLAEAINLPVMVAFDAFFVSHTYEPVSIPDQKDVDKFLPKYKPRFELDCKKPYALNQMVAPTSYMEMRHDIQMSMEIAQEKYAQIEEEFNEIFQRKYGIVEEIETDDADLVIVLTGSATSTCRQFIKDQRAKGEKVGLLKMRMFRPFPFDVIQKSLANAKKVAVIDRNCSFGAGGIFAQEVKSALCNEDNQKVYSYIAGLGGRDITLKTLEDIYLKTIESEKPQSKSVWIDVNRDNIPKGFF